MVSGAGLQYDAHLVGHSVNFRFVILQAGGFKRDYGRLMSHVAEALGQRFILRAQISQAEGLQSGSFHLTLVE